MRNSLRSTCNISRFWHRPLEIFHQKHFNRLFHHNNIIFLKKTYTSYSISPKLSIDIKIWKRFLHVPLPLRSVIFRGPLRNIAEVPVHDNIISFEKIFSKMLDYFQNFQKLNPLKIFHYRITRFFRWEFIFTLFASDVESAKIVK